MAVFYYCLFNSNVGKMIRPVNFESNLEGGLERIGHFVSS